MMYHKCHAELAPIRPLSKFIVVKAVVFVTFWQVGEGRIYGSTCHPIRSVCRAITTFLSLPFWQGVAIAILVYKVCVAYKGGGISCLPYAARNAPPTPTRLPSPCFPLP